MVLAALLLAPAPAAVADQGPDPTGQEAPTEPTPTAVSDTDTAATVQPLAGPLSLSLGAEARLDLPAAWRFVPREQLKAYFSGGERRLGAWDLGVALGPDAAEYRVQFQPLGAVDESDPSRVAPEPLLARLQSLAEAGNLRRRAAGQTEEQFGPWLEAPAYDPAVHGLTWGERRLIGVEEKLGWHGRLLGRAGVLKLDLQFAPEQAAASAAGARTLFGALGFQDGRGPGPVAGASKTGLDDLVIDALLGRGSQAGAEVTEPTPWGWWLALWAAAAAILSAAVLAGWRTYRRWSDFRTQAQVDEARLAKLERDLGGRGDDVEEIREDDDSKGPTSGR